MASRAASRSAATRLVGSARPVPAMSKAVPWSGEVRTKGRPSVTLTAWSKAQRLDRDQRLVVIHAQGDVVGGAGLRVEQRVRRQRAACIDAVGDEALDRRRDDGDVLLAQRAFFAGMRVEPGNGQARVGEAEALGQVARDDTSGIDDRARRRAA